MDSIQLIILAAGKGVRMESKLPKVLVPLNGKPLIAHLLEHVAKAGFTRKPVLVVGHEAELVKNTLGPAYLYVHQKTQLGTGHAVQTTEEILRSSNAEHLMVLYGDHPLVDSNTIQTIAKEHLTHHRPLTMATVKVDDFKEWRGAFERYGRIIRDAKGSIERIIEYKDATDAERAITEVNPSYFCFEASWLWANLEKLKNENVQHEFYLTDLVGIARNQGEKITGININPITALGANTKAELQTLEKMLKRS